MADLGVLFAWLAVRATLVLVPAALLHARASRRGPAWGSWVAGAGLAAVVASSLAALVPRGEWVAGDGAPTRVEGREITAGAGTRSGSIGSGDGEVPRGLDLRLAWERFGRATAAPADSCRSWGTVLAIVGLAGTGGALLHLFVGLGAVHLCRRRGRLVDDPEVLRLRDELRDALGCRRPVEICEIPGLVAPATAGWLRAVVLLPADWRSWDAAERRAVLAHELAHVLRADYATALVARLALALHFYHPLARWLSARLRLQQELAADALAARLTGGAEPYLKVLAGLALRMDARAPGWPARAFLPARGTLIRRIAMLRTDAGTAERPATGWRRILVSGVLVAVAAGVLTLRRPARALAAEAPAAQGTEVAPFELSFIPEDATGFVAIRPAAIFRGAGMGRHLETATRYFPLMLAEAGIDLVVDPVGAGFPVPFDTIEQVTAGFFLSKRPTKTGSQGVMTAHGLMIRSVEPFDWAKQVRAWWPRGEVVHAEGRTYLKVTGVPAFEPDACFYVPDARTLVMDHEESLLRTLRRSTPREPSSIQGPDWGRVGRGLFVLAFDNRDGRCTQVFRNTLSEAAKITPLFEHAEHWAFALDNADACDFRAIATCRDEAAAAATARAVVPFVEATLAEMDHPPDAAQARTRPDPLTALLMGCRVEQDGSSVILRSTGFGTLAEFFRLAF